MSRGFGRHHRFRAEAEPIHHAGAEILDDDVGRGDELAARGRGPRRS